MTDVQASGEATRSRASDARAAVPHEEWYFCYASSIPPILDGTKQVHRLCCLAEADQGVARKRHLRDEALQ